MVSLGMHASLAKPTPLPSQIPMPHGGQLLDPSVSPRVHASLLKSTLLQLQTQRPSPPQLLASGPTWLHCFRLRPHDSCFPGCWLLVLLVRHCAHASLAKSMLLQLHTPLNLQLLAAGSWIPRLCCFSSRTHDLHLTQPLAPGPSRDSQSETTLENACLPLHGFWDLCRDSYVLTEGAS